MGGLSPLALCSKELIGNLELTNSVGLDSLSTQDIKVWTGFVTVTRVYVGLTQLPLSDCVSLKL